MLQVFQRHLNFDKNKYPSFYNLKSLKDLTSTIFKQEYGSQKESRS